MALRRAIACRSAWDTLSEWCIAASGYRKYGLRAEDLIREEAPGVTEALRRMPQDYSDERYFRLKRAMNLSMQYKYLPADQCVTSETDKRELIPVIKQVRKELAERQAWDSQNA